MIILNRIRKPKPVKESLQLDNKFFEIILNVEIFSFMKIKRTFNVKLENYHAFGCVLNVKLIPIFK